MKASKGKLKGLVLLAALLPFFVANPSVLAQKPTLHFDEPPRFSALAGTRVNGIAQDRRGYMWMATDNGLHRYDGYEVRSYRHDPAKPDSLSADHAGAVLVDRQDRIWVGTSRGLDRYEPQSDGFTHIPLDLALGGVLCLAQNTTETLWLGTGKGLFSLSVESMTTKKWSLSQPEQAIHALCFDQQNRLWIGGNKGFRLDPDGQVFALEVAEQILTFCPGSEGTLWIGTKNGLFKRPARGRPIRVPAGGMRNIKALLEDGDGRLWIGTYLGGLRLLDGSFSHNFIEQPGSSFPVKSVWTVFQDRAENLWFGTNQGFLVLPRVNRILSHFGADASLQEGLKDASVWCFFQDRRGVVWLGTDRGLFRWNEHAGTFSHWLPQAGQPDDIGANRVRSIYQDETGTFWIGGRQKLHLFHPDKGFFRTFENNDRYKLGSMRAIIQDGGRIWLASLHGGLLYYERDSDQIEPFTGHPSLRRGTRCLAKSDSGALLVGTDMGLFSLDPVSMKPTAHAFRAQVLSLAQIHADRIWIGTKNGLARLQRLAGEEERLTWYSKVHGLEGSMIYGIVPDEAGCLWLSSELGLYVFDPKTEKVMAFRAYHGLQGDDFGSGSFLKDNRGRLFFGGSKGFNVFQPEALKALPSPSDIVLDKVLLNHRELRPSTTTNPAAGDTSTEQPLILNHTHKVVTFKFSALQYTAAHAIRYAFKLEGFDKDWTEARADSRVATYTNLDPKAYTFRVKGMDSFGRWMPAEQQLEMVIHPAWWNSVWARFLYTVLVVLLLLAIAMLRRRKHTRERQHWQALDEKNKELLRTQSQLVMQEKMASVGLLTAGIAHEIKNPTTFTNLSAQNLNADLADFHDWLLELAGPDVEEAFRVLLQARIATLSEHLDLIHEGCTRIVHLAENLQTFSRADNAVQVVKLTDGIRSTLNLVRAKFRDQVKFRMCFEDPLETWCKSGQMNQVFMNLIVNACQEIQACNQQTGHKGTLSIYTESRGDWGVIRFKDTGRGMDSAVVDRIFEPFFTTKTSAEGTGLGLAISARIIGQHGGHIVVESEQGKGTTFIISMPKAGPAKTQIKSFEDETPSPEGN